MKKLIAVLSIIIFMNTISVTTIAEEAAIDNATVNEVIGDYLDMANFYELNKDYKKALEYIEIVLSINPENFEATKKKEYLLEILRPNKAATEKCEDKKQETVFEPTQENNTQKTLQPVEFEGVKIPIKTATGVVETIPGIVQIIEPKTEKVQQQELPANKEESTVLATTQECDIKTEKQETIKTDTAISNPELPQPQVQQPQEQQTKNDIKNADEYEKLGMQAYLQSDFDKSIEYFQNSLKLEPTNAVVYNNLGMAYWKKNDVKTAIKYFNQSFEIDKSYTQPLLNLSLIYKQLKDENKELDYLNKAATANPDDYGTYYLLGNYYYQKGYLPLASENYRKTIEKKSDFIEAYYGLGATLYALNDFTQSAKILEKATLLQNNSDKIYYALSKSLIALGNYPKARDYLEEAILINQDDRYVSALAKVHYCLSNFEKSVELYQILLKENNKAALYNDLGLAQYQLGQYKKAMNSFENAIQEMPNKSIYRYNFALCCKAMNKNKLYQQILSETLAMQLQTAQDYIDLSYIYNDLGNPQKALDILDEGLKTFADSQIIYFAKFKLCAITSNSEELKKTKILYDKKFGK